jgi:hypothetical protein
MEPESSLPFPHDTATHPYSKIAESSPQFTTQNKIYFNIIFLSTPSPYLVQWIFSHPNLDILLHCHVIACK